MSIFSDFHFEFFIRSEKGFVNKILIQNINGEPVGDHRSYLMVSFTDDLYHWITNVGLIKKNWQKYMAINGIIIYYWKIILLLLKLSRNIKQTLCITTEPTEIFLIYHTFLRWEIHHKILTIIVLNLML